jgi:hypothetical protein
MSQIRVHREYTITEFSIGAMYTNGYVRNLFQASTNFMQINETKFNKNKQFVF